MATAKFPDKAPGETKLVTFDFTNECATGVALSNPSVVKSLDSGSDTNAATLTVGTPAVSGLTVKVLVGAGTDANKYKLLATVTADNGEVHQLAGILAVKTSAQ
jgi:hypothetical protein